MPIQQEPATTLDQIQENFDILEDWPDRYGYIIELGKQLPDFPKELQTKENKVDGCMSQVWLVPRLLSPGPPARFIFLADSDAHIVKGLIAILLAMFSGRNAQEILDYDPMPVFEKLGLSQHLSVGRRNGVESMIKRIKMLAATQTDTSD